MAKKTLKAVKKSAPKKKLIEGKYALKILTRLTPSEAEILDQLKKDLQNKTFNGAFVEIITKFKKANDDLKEAQKELSELKDKSADMVETISDFQKVNKKIQNMVLQQLNVKMIQCSSCYDEFPEHKLKKIHGQMLCEDCR